MQNENNFYQPQNPVNPVPVTPAPEKRCANCQALLAENEAFCHDCGAPVSNGYAAPTAPVVPEVNPAIAQYNATVTAPKRNKALPFIIGGICTAVVATLIIILVAIGGGSDSSSSKPKTLNFRKEFSDISSESWCEIASDGSYMRLDTNPYDEDDHIDLEAWEAIQEVNSKLGFTDALSEKMGETRAMDGRQTDENSKCKVSWSYHPDSGLEVLYEKK